VDVDLYITGSGSRQIPAGERPLGLWKSGNPGILDKLIEGAGNSRKYEVRKGSAQETRGLGQAAAARTVR